MSGKDTRGGYRRETRKADLFDVRATELPASLRQLLVSDLNDGF